MTLYCIDEPSIFHDEIKFLGPHPDRRFDLIPPKVTSSWTRENVSQTLLCKIWPWLRDRGYCRKFKAQLFCRIFFCKLD